MKRLPFILFFLTIAVAGTLRAQCLSGNCISGKGKYDFGWCSYEGGFKDGKPDGAGTMKYSDYTYTGHFSNGIEDGDGSITYSDGKKESVRYIKGQKVAGPATIAASDYKPVEGHDPGCISGDCNNGYGTYQFPSGNKYTGNFKDRNREGNGTFYFSNGEQFTGQFHNNGFSNGTYTFQSGAQYTGTYNAAGKELNGTVSAGSRRVPITNGKAIIPKEERYGYENTQATREAAAEARKGKPKYQTTQWGMPEKTAIERDRESFDKMMHEMDARQRRLDMPTYSQW